MKIKQLPQNNYYSMMVGSKTYRFKYDHNKPHTQLDWPEFLDVAINNYCTVGCSYCYPQAGKNGKQYQNIVEKIYSIFSHLDQNQRPFQIALGGEGEPTQHPEFIQVLKAFSDCEIIPNLTTSGINLTEQNIQAMVDYSKGVAISLHPHIIKVWKKAIQKLKDLPLQLKCHIVVSDQNSIEYFFKCFNEHFNDFEHFVVLPYMGNRNGKERDVLIEKFGELFFMLSKEQQSKIAFGANMIPWLEQNKSNIENLSLYGAHLYSRYLILDDPIAMYQDSHSLIPVENCYAKEISV